jgi:hypothetical protein
MSVVLVCEGIDKQLANNMIFIMFLLHFYKLQERKTVKVCTDNRGLHGPLLDSATTGTC